MLTGRMLKNIDKKRRQAAQNARYPTDRIFDITGPYGNIFWLIAACNDVMRSLKFSQEEIAEFKADTDNLPYEQRLAKMQEWFGFVYITHEDKK